MRRSAGILPYRIVDGEVEVLLVHPGGPFWEGKDDGVWSISKGLIEDGESAFDTAVREFKEETGWEVEGNLISLGIVQQSSHKTVEVWATDAYYDVSTFRSNEIEIEYPPSSGKKITIPEIDGAGWFKRSEIGTKMVKGQRELVDRLVNILSVSKNTEVEEIFTISDNQDEVWKYIHETCRKFIDKISKPPQNCSEVWCNMLKSSIIFQSTDGRIQAGILRDMGIKIPDNIPDVASTDASKIVIIPDKDEVDEQEHSFTMNANIQTDKFEWITINMTIKPKENVDAD